MIWIEKSSSASVDVNELKKEYATLTDKDHKIAWAKERMNKVINWNVSLSDVINKIKNNELTKRPACQEVVMGVQAALNILWYNVWGIDWIWWNNSKAAMEQFWKKYKCEGLSQKSLQALVEAVIKSWELERLSKEVENVSTYKFWKKNKVERKDVVTLIDSLSNPFDEMLLNYVKTDNIKWLQHYLNSVIIKASDKYKTDLVNHLKDKWIWLQNNQLIEDNKFWPQTLETINFLVANPEPLFSVGAMSRTMKELNNLEWQIDTKKNWKKEWQGVEKKSQNKNDVKLYGWRKMEKVKWRELAGVIVKVNRKYPQFAEKMNKFVKERNVKWLQTELNKMLDNITPQNKNRIKKNLENKWIWLNNGHIYEDWKLWQQTMEVLKSFLDN